MIKKIFGIIFLALFILTSCSYANASENNSELIFNNYFSFTMPAEVQGTYYAEKIGNGIYISEKISKKSGEGGFAFAFRLFKNPQEYTDMEGVKKIGELKDKTGALYDMVLIRPNEIRYGEGEKIAKNYNKLYNIADNLDPEGVNGSVYSKNQGMKGEDLYKDILQKYKKVFDENWTTAKQYKDANINMAYYYFFKPDEILADKIGYVYYDVNSDGIDELIIGKITKGRFKGIIYDIYTMVNRKPQHVLSGNNIDKYFICNDNFICNEDSFNENKSRNSFIVYKLENNSTKIHPQIIFTYDVNKNKNQPWFISYNFTGEKENVSKKIFQERKGTYSKKYNRLNFTPFSKVN